VPIRNQNPDRQSGWSCRSRTNPPRVGSKSAIVLPAISWHWQKMSRSNCDKDDCCLCGRELSQTLRTLRSSPNRACRVPIVGSSGLTSAFREQNSPAWQEETSATMSDLKKSGKDQTYFIRNRGRVLGPFSVEKLISLRARGQFSRAHEVSTDRQNWQPASALDDLIAPARSARGISDPLGQDAGVVAPAGQFPSPTGMSTPGANWHYNIGGELHGPVSIMELRSMINAAKLHSDDYVWKEGMPDWLPVSQIPELQPAKAPAPAAAGYAPLHDDGIQHTSGLAVASLVMGIVGLVTPFSFSICWRRYSVQPP